MYWELAKSNAAATGLMIVSAREYFQDSIPYIWWKDAVPNYQSMGSEDLPSDIVFGHRFTTVVLDPLAYLKWLEQQFMTLGGKRKYCSISHIRDALEDDVADVIVNTLNDALSTGCTNRHRKSISKMTNLIADACHLRTVVAVKGRDEWQLVPRLTGTVAIGSTEPQGIMEKVGKFDLGAEKLRVLGIKVDLCDAREDGPRVENEFVGNWPVWQTHPDYP
ncbi:hypothetical protein DFQ28_005499 [Apophysomyces sp. BC1034]|nr:hypothetical protein DFQ28_005499 [Apophysomyces sp. BC1034]